MFLHSQDLYLFFPHRYLWWEAITWPLDIVDGGTEPIAYSRVSLKFDCVLVTIIYHKPPQAVVLSDDMFRQALVETACSPPEASAEGAWRQKQKQNPRQGPSNRYSLLSLGVDVGYWPPCFHVAWASSQYGSWAPSVGISRKSQVDSTLPFITQP